MRLNPAAHDGGRDLAQVLKQLRVGDPRRSPLYTKALGGDHLGGKSVAAGSCEAKLLASWIQGRRELAPCVAPAQAAPLATPGAALPPSLRALLPGCARPACHGGAVGPYLLDPARPGADAVDVEALAPSLDRFLPSRSRLLARLLGAGDHPRSIASTDDPVYRELHAWVSGEAVVRAPAPSFEAFERDVQPILERRGCTNGGCHGASTADFILVGTREAVIDNYLRIVPRVAAGLFPAKPRNLEPHGGGRRLGAPDEDCASATIGGWIGGAAPAACRSRALPDRARFASLVQPSLEKLTCPRCHEGGKLDFLFTAHPDAVGLERNYQSVLRKIDLDYPPASAVLLRVHEDCMQARLLSWVDRQPDPGCTVELKNFRGSFPPAP